MFNPLKSYALAFLRRIRTLLVITGKKYLECGKDLHVGANVRLWAPHHISIGDCVYIGKDSFIEANCTIGNYCLLGNRVAFVGRNDHDYLALGVPIRLAPWIGSKDFKDQIVRTEQEVTVEDDVWIGYGAIVLTGVRICRGAIVAAGSVVVSDVEPYSLVAGVPAKKVGFRFSKDQILRHEEKIAKGRFKYSSRGEDYWIVEPFEY